MIECDIHTPINYEEILSYIEPSQREWFRTRGPSLGLSDYPWSHPVDWFRADAEQRRVEWGSRTSDYRGWMEVSPEGKGSRLTLFLATARGDAPDSEVMGTLDAIRRLVESRV